MFRGANAISLDKGRLAMPSRYRDELISRSSGQLIITIDAVDPCLCVYPLDEWELIETKLRALPSLREENRRLQRLLIGNAVDLELDGSGRFLVPPRLREYAKLDKRAMLVGQLNKFNCGTKMPGMLCLQLTWLLFNNRALCLMNCVI